ncbi:uncharacterized protein PV09_05840 [Verruconis gallopava]|uniref:DUF7730 domain-containing protein n=1 Tax=Verruconis gallopava TaxID=253628 RepID=A0A0D2A7N8_9PEZI|nr:uncharacterized protein PV09_05840 [Verruconis gallopava]KIW02778.1 hypothetical protein PV09_05840 [Verruconis gallopava]
MRISISCGRSSTISNRNDAREDQELTPQRTISRHIVKRPPLQQPIFPQNPIIRPNFGVPSRASASKGRYRTGIDRSSNITSPFMRLPPELRVCIYRYIIPPSDSKFRVYTDCSQTYTDRKWDVQRPRLTSDNNPDSLALLRINKLIYYEALSVLYSENTFHFIGCNFLPIIDFIRKLSPDAKALVRQLKITMLPEARHLTGSQLELFCRVVHEWLPGLNALASDTWMWI